MNKGSGKFTIWGAALSFLFLAACGGSGGDAADADTPEGQAFQFRQAVMRVMTAKLTTIRDMEREEIPLDEAVFAKATADLAVMTGMLTEGFDTEGIATGSRALPDIWSNWDDFTQKANDAVSGAASLAAATAQGGFATGQGLVDGAAQACGACHRVYRQRSE